jgi:glycosyltransferase involved in cell wall biosynthesis
VNVSNYKVKKNYNSSFFKITWVGSPSTSRHINIASKALKIYCNQGNVEFRAIGARQKDLYEIPGKYIPWNEKSETEELKSCEVGIMPLPNTPWEKGKCGFKLIQYMAAGLPVIASPVGANSAIVEHGVNGFLAHDTQEWIKYFKILHNDPDLRQRMGKAGREKVKKKYSLEIAAPKLISILKKASRT